MYCRKCGQELPKHGKFCRKCGTAIPVTGTAAAAVHYGPGLAAVGIGCAILALGISAYRSPAQRNAEAADSMAQAIESSLARSEGVYTIAARQKVQEILAAADEEGTVSYPVLCQTAESVMEVLTDEDQNMVTVDNYYRKGGKLTAEVTVLGRDTEEVMERFIRDISSGTEDPLKVLMNKSKKGSLERYVVNHMNQAVDKVDQNIRVSGQVILSESGDTYLVEQADEEVCLAVNGLEKNETSAASATLPPEPEDGKKPVQTDVPEDSGIPDSLKLLGEQAMHL